MFSLQGPPSVSGVMVLAMFAPPSLCDIQDTSPQTTDNFNAQKDRQRSSSLAVHRFCSGPSHFQYSYPGSFGDILVSSHEALSTLVWNDQYPAPSDRTGLHSSVICGCLFPGVRFLPGVPHLVRHSMVVVQDLIIDNPVVLVNCIGLCSWNLYDCRLLPHHNYQGNSNV